MFMFLIVLQTITLNEIHNISNIYHEEEYILLSLSIFYASENCHVMLAKLIIIAKLLIYLK